VLIELFALSVTAALRANIKYEQSHGLFATAKRLALLSELAYVTTHFDSPSSPHFLADILPAKTSPSLAARYVVHVRFIGKRVVNFLLVLIERFRQVSRLRR